MKSKLRTFELSKLVFLVNLNIFVIHGVKLIYDPGT